MSDGQPEEYAEESTTDAPMDAAEDGNDSVAPDESNDNDMDDESKSVVPDENDEGDEDGEEEETKSMATSNALEDEEEDEEEEEDESKSVGTSNMAEAEAEAETASASAQPDAAPVAPPKKKRGKPQIPASARKGRAPAVKGLNIPFRTVKKAMKLDPDIPIVQNEAAIMTTLAAELFLKRLANQSQKICKNRGKNTIRYEDVADARSNDPALAFLKTIIP
mmetsp:Transcript_23127/g.54607  ORF Transcript_23127/g.54607 Transcript_23127/m.54607 type:complete len:221 (-) Transcript_23127:132-794(-)